MTTLLLLSACQRNTPAPANREGVIAHAALAKPFSRYFNQMPQLLQLDSDKLLLTAFGGLMENNADQRSWFSMGSAATLRFETPSTLTHAQDVTKDEIVYNGSLFRLADGRIAQFSMVAAYRAGSASGNAAIQLAYQISNNEGRSWSHMTRPKVQGIEQASFKFGGPIGDPVKLAGDTLGFALHYRYTGVSTARFGMLKCTKDLSYFRIDTFPQYQAAHPQKLIEPVALKRNDTIFTFFRTTLGRIAYISSGDDGRSWSSLQTLSLIAPSAPLAVVVKDQDFYIACNLSLHKRDNLALLRTRDLKSFSYLCTIDKNAAGEQNEISYPHLSLRGNRLYVAYSKTYADNGQCAIAGDIHIRQYLTDTLKAVEETSAEAGGMDYFVADAFSHDNMLYTLRSNGYFSSSTARGEILSARHLDSSAVYYSMVHLPGDSILVSCSRGFLLSADMGKSWKVQQIGGLENQHMSTFSHDSRIVLHHEKQVSIIDPALRIIAQYTLPANNAGTGAYAMQNNFATAGIAHMQRIIVVNEQGHVFHLIDNMLQHASGAQLPRQLTAMEITSDGVYIGDASGNIYFEKELLYAAPKSVNAPVLQLMHTRKGWLALRSDGVTGIDTDKQVRSLLQVSPLSEWLVKIVKLNETYYALGAFGNLYPINN